MSPLPIFQKILKVGEDDDIALLAPGRKPLTFRGLREQVTHVKEQLNEKGLGMGDRIALVLPNGPEMAMAFLSVVSGMCAAPINPSLQTAELEFSLADIGAAAIIVESNLDSPVWDVASRLKIPIVSLEPSLDSEAGMFELSGEEVGPPKKLREPQSKDVALLLHTSGTTARPKLVPLTQENISVSVENVVLSLGLLSNDRCLHIMPMFHIHGLIASLLSSLSSGGSVICPSGFNAFLFAPWVNEFRPTWYSAVPSMHHGILSCLKRFSGNVLQYELRFVRSSSAALPASVQRQLEEVFGAPVIEAYGMTEASHQIVLLSSFSPGKHGPGFVGKPAGTEVAIVDENGKELHPGERGEIVIKGRNVMEGYENNSKANAESYFGKWFRTGDEGLIDDAGHLTLTGRLKEIINRGGEKVAPSEIDAVIQEHPTVEQAATFGFQHEDVGEEIGVLIVIKKGQKTTDENIKKFVAERLAPFKVPRKVVFVQEIPKSPTGKIVRKELADKFGSG